MFHLFTQERMLPLLDHYANNVLNKLTQRHPHEPEFLQAAQEILHSLEPILLKHPEYEKSGLLERFTEPERAIIFRVPWTDDAGKLQVNRAFRVQFSSTLGPYKGGLRFHPTVNLSVIKFLGLEQTLKNSLTGLPIGGGKGGSDFDPKGKSDGEVMRFCQSLMSELYRHIGPDTDVPAGDIGVGAREIGFLYGQYKRLTGRYEGVLTGKGLIYGGSLGRKQATGYGLLYLLEAMLEQQNIFPDCLRVIVSGSGNVAIYAAEKAAQMGMTVIAMGDSAGFIEDTKGIKLDVVKQIKEVERGRLEEYARRVPGSSYTPGAQGIWQLPCDIALPCATQNEMDEEGAKALIRNGVKAVAEGANMPLTPQAAALIISSEVLYAPGKAANAGGVAVSALEMSQNSLRLQWSFEEVDTRLKSIMRNIFASISTAATTYGQPKNYAMGANIAGFEKVAEGMMQQGYV